MRTVALPLDTLLLPSFKKAVVTLYEIPLISHLLSFAVCHLFMIHVLSNLIRTRGSYRSILLYP